MARLIVTAAVVLAAISTTFGSAARGGESGLNYIVPIAAESNDGAVVRPTLPDLIFADGSGMPVHLRQFAGQVVVLNFYSSACAPCLKELFLLDRLQGNNRGRPLSVVAISEDQTGIATVKSFLGHQKYSYLRAFADPNSSMAEALGIANLPTSIIVDKYNRQIVKITGSYQWEDPGVLARLQKLMTDP